MSTAVMRLMRELKDARLMSADPSTDMKLDLVREDDVFRWAALIYGPPDTPFHGGTYKVELSIPPEYPMLPPTAKFLTPVFHPNVKKETGEICLDVLKSKWSPAWTLQSVCRAIQALMSHPEADSPLNCDAGNMLRSGDMEAYNSMVRYYAVREAGAPESSW